VGRFLPLELLKFFVDSHDPISSHEPAEDVASCTSRLLIGLHQTQRLIA